MVTISRAEYEQLQQEKAQMESTRVRLEAERIKLEAEHARLEAKLAALEQEQAQVITSLTLQNEWLLEQLKLSKKKLFGRSSEQAEQLVMDQLGLIMNEAEAYIFGMNSAGKAPVTVKAYERKRQSGNVLDVVPEGTPAEVVEHRLPENERICSACGSEMVEIGKEVRRSLMMEPAEFWVREDVYYTYACKNCEQETGEANIVKAAKKAFDELGVKRLPSVKSLQEEYAKLLSEKKAAYAEYRRSRDEMRELLLHKQNVDRMLGKNERSEERNRSMTASNGYAPKRFGETRSRTILCVQRVSGALPLTSRGEFSQWRKLPKKQSGCLFALLAAFVPNSVQDRLYRVFCYTEIEGKDRITRGFRPQKLGITAFFVLSFPPYSLKIFFKIPIRLLHFKRIYAILKKYLVCITKNIKGRDSDCEKRP